MNTKILIISKFYFPDNTPRAFRTFELAKQFSKQGYDVSVLIPNVTEKQVNHSQSLNIKLINLGIIDFSDFKTNIKVIDRTIFRSLNLLFDYPDIKLFPKIFRFLKTSNDYDVILSIAVPHSIHWAVAYFLSINKKNKIRWIADCGDPFMGSETDTFKKLFYFEYIERFFCKKADYITVPFEGAIDSYYKEFKNKIKVIPQGFKFFKKNSIDGSKLKFSHNKKVFLYAGSFIKGLRDPSKFLKYLSKIDLDFCFLVYTNDDKCLEVFKKILGSKLKISKYIDRINLFKIMYNVDFLINFDNNVSGQLPSKLIDYAMTSKPILNIESDLNINIIDEFLNGDYSNSLKIHNLDDYKIENVTNKFIDLF